MDDDRPNSTANSTAHAGGDAAADMTGDRAAATIDTTTAAEQLAELRGVILGPAAPRIERVAALDEPGLRAEFVAGVLAEAIDLRGADVGRALAPTMDAAIRESVERDPGRFADAIFPVIGPAVRRAVADAIQRMMQGVNAAVEHSVSPRGLMWRLEAVRTGVPYAQVVLRHTLAYRVEQVLLIHRETGLVLAHVSAPGAEAKDPDLVGGMLTALRDFAEDAYGEGEGASLEEFTVGELRVRAAAGPKALVACAVRGEAPLELEDLLQSTVETIHRRRARELDRFEGEDAPFAACEPDLRRCLASQALPRDRRPFAAAMPAAFAAAAVVALAAWWGVSSWRVGQRWNGVVERLGAEPGLVVLAHERGWSGLRVRGLADPLARAPSEVISASGLDGSRVRMEFAPFVSLEPALVLRRVEAALAPLPPGMRADLSAAGVLSLKGVASGRWVERATEVARAQPGVAAVDVSGVGVADPDGLLVARAEAVLRPPAGVRLRASGGVVFAEGEAPGAWVRGARRSWGSIEGALRYDEEGLTNADLVRAAGLAERARAVVVRFDASGSVALREEDARRVPAVALLLAELGGAATAAGFEARVTLVGHTDRVGAPERNEALSLARAEVVRDALVQAGATPARAVGAGSALASGDEAEDRRVTIEIELVPDAEADG